MSLIGRDVDSSNSPVPMLDMSKMRYNSALALSKMDIHINNALREPFRQLMKTKGHTLSKQTQVSVQTSCHSRSQQVCMVMLNWSVLYCQFAADMWLHLVGVALVYVADVVCRNHDICSPVKYLSRAKQFNASLQARLARRRSHTCVATKGKGGYYLHVGMPWDLIQGYKANDLHVFLWQILEVVLLFGRDGHRLLAILHTPSIQLKPCSTMGVAEGTAASRLSG